MTTTNFSRSIINSISSSVPSGMPRSRSLDSLLLRLHISSEEESRGNPVTVGGKEILEQKVLNEHDNNRSTCHGYKDCISEKEERRKEEVKVDDKENIKPKVLNGHKNNRFISNDFENCIEGGCQSSRKNGITVNKSSWATIRIELHESEYKFPHRCVKYVARGVSSDKYNVKENEPEKGADSDSSVSFPLDLDSGDSENFTEVSDTGESDQTVQTHTFDIRGDLLSHQTQETVITRGYSQYQAQGASVSVSVGPLSEKQKVKKLAKDIAAWAQEFEQGNIHNIEQRTPNPASSTTQQRVRRRSSSSSDNRVHPYAPHTHSSDMSNQPCLSTSSVLHIPIPTVVHQMQEGSRRPEIPILPRTTAVSETPTLQPTHGMARVSNILSAAASTTTTPFNTAGAVLHDSSTSYSQQGVRMNISTTENYQTTTLARPRTTTASASYVTCQPAGLIGSSSVRHSLGTGNSNMDSATSSFTTGQVSDTRIPRPVGGFQPIHSQRMWGQVDSFAYQQLQQLPPPGLPQSARALEGLAHRMVWGMSTERLLSTENDTDLLQRIKQNPYLLGAICARLRREQNEDEADRLETSLTPSKYPPKPPSPPSDV